MTDRSTHHCRQALIVAMAATCLSLAGPPAAASGAATQPATVPGLGPAPWSQRAITAQVAGRSVTSDLGPGRTERWIAAVVAAEAMVGDLLGTGNMLARATPPRKLLLFADDADFRRELRGRFGEVAEGTAAMSTLFADEQFLAGTIPPVPPVADGAVAPPRAPAEADLAAAAADLLAESARASYDRYFEDDMPPALAAAIELLAAESIVLEDGIHPGHPAGETLVAAQVLLRDKSPDLPAILAVDGRGWEELTPEDQADATLVAWSFVQFATTRNGGGAVQVLRSLGSRLNAGDRPSTAVVRAAGDRDWRTVLGGWRRWLESTTPDPTSDAINRIEALAAGLKELAADDVVVTDLDSAATALAARGFVWRAIRRGIRVEIAVDGPATFTFEEDPETGRRPEIRVTPPRTAGGVGQAANPAGIDVRGLRIGRIAVSWDRSEDGPVRRMGVR